MVEIPVWGQYSLAGVFLAVILWVVIEVLRGSLIPGKRQDQIQAQHIAELAAAEKRHETELAEANERSRAWQEAWQASQNLAFQQTDTIAHLAALAEVFEAFIKSLPSLEDVRNEER